MRNFTATVKERGPDDSCFVVLERDVGNLIVLNVDDFATARSVANMLNEHVNSIVPFGALKPRPKHTADETEEMRRARDKMASEMRLQGATFKQIGEELGFTPSAAASACRRVDRRRKLRLRFEGRSADEITVDEVLGLRDGHLLTKAGLVTIGQVKAATDAELRSITGYNNMASVRRLRRLISTIETDW